MDNVKSSLGLTEELLKLGVGHAAPKAAAAADVLENDVAFPRPRPVAIVGVHGISPIQQYGFQDQLATGLRAYLNTLEAAGGSGRTWLATTYWPQVSKHPKNPVLKPSALRVHRDDEADPEKPAGRVYDVYEGYWSPFSKGKTNIASLLMWLLRITFLATSSTANVPASWRKLKWDVGYLVGALLLAVACLVAAFVAGTIAWTHFVALVNPAGAPTTGGFFDIAFNPLDQVKLLPFIGWLQLAFDVLIAYLIVQLVVVWNARKKTSSRTAELRKDGSEKGHFATATIAADAFHRFTTRLFVAIVIVLFIVDALVLAHSHHDVLRIVWHAAWLVAAVALFQAARGIADYAVENVLGDVQVYCTHDCNSSFYAYGRFFTLERSALSGKDNRDGIFWSNHWYFHDIVANEIVSYASDVYPGTSFKWTGSEADHPICENNLIEHPKPFWAFVHSDYIGDPQFWKNAGPVFTS